MRITSFGSVLLLAAFALVSGCPAETVGGGTPCDGDSDCATGQYCAGGGVGCTFDCRTDVDCLGAGGGTCDSRGRCQRGGTDGGVPTDGAPPDAPTLCRNDADCDDETYCNGPERCAPGPDARPDGCVAGVAPCASGTTCDEAAEACRTSCDEDVDGNGRIDADNDGDGHRSIACGPSGAVAGDDCDDADADRFPRSLVEVCDPLAPDHDEDCNPCTVASYIASDGDRDTDRYYATECSNPLLASDDPATFSCPVAVRDFITIDRATGLVTGTDCNDDPAHGGGGVHPTEAESCNGIDDNCSGEIDEGVQVTVYLDCDGDTYGDPDNARTGCDGEIASATDPCPDVGRWIVAAGDPMGCDFGVGAASRYASAVESCNDIDDDCDGVVDDGAERTWYRDGDGDGFGNVAGGQMMACDQPAGYAPTSPIDCDDSTSAINPSQFERCDVARVDENCDGSMNVGCVCSVDGAAMDCTLPYPNCPAATQTCRMDAIGSSWGACSVTPTTVTCYADGDGDGYAVAGAASETACACRPLWTTRAPTAGNIDCDGGRTDVNPGRPELCNGIDDNCVSGADEGLRSNLFRDADGDTVGAGPATSVCNGTPGWVTSGSDCNDGDASRYRQIDGYRLDADGDRYCGGSTTSWCVGNDASIIGFGLIAAWMCVGEDCTDFNYYANSDCGSRTVRDGDRHSCGWPSVCTWTDTVDCGPGWRGSSAPGYDQCRCGVTMGGGGCSGTVTSTSGNTRSCRITQSPVCCASHDVYAEIGCEPCGITSCAF
jgi:hypothetical protein